MTILTHHGKTRECCEWVIKNNENREDLKGNLSVQSWIQASKERLKELDEQEGEKQLCLNF